MNGNRENANREQDRKILPPFDRLTSKKFVFRNFVPDITFLSKFTSYLYLN